MAGVTGRKVKNKPKPQQPLRGLVIAPDVGAAAAGADDGLCLQPTEDDLGLVYAQFMWGAVLWLDETTDDYFDDLKGWTPAQQREKTGVLVYDVRNAAAYDSYLTGMKEPKSEPIDFGTHARMPPD